ncbi:3-deoxy-D-manno-octulosonic acid transferase [Paracoccus sp. (in: a-proteobacteria)]|uniref:3-deoxy-D-manno-octulosonic acid transferase n=1 Tax=Paracoccus sp. TaxID=267 RepID=UPI0026DEDA7F|nr:glycosyltransferase N-terminal domain-containing protein [Paracoccus sp. (in: a-proteobacteria)]MDO5647209.1 glycosyltransferase N-terminal domain-containing protein [Paracoccus sp. (in: a-proteobacteria)]
MPAGLGPLGLWLHLTGGAAGALPPVPPGDGPALIIATAPDGAAAEPHIRRQVLRLRPDLRIVALTSDAADRDSVGMARLIATARPAAALLIGSGQPAALISACTTAHIPVIMAESRLDAAQGWGLRAQMRRHVLRQVAHVMLPDAASHAAALRMGVRADALTMTGPIAEIREPLRCAEAERVLMAEQMDGRHAWFAAALPPSEEPAVLAAHQAALRLSHRALLIIAPTDGARMDDLAARVTEQGLTVARRDHDEEPEDDVQVYLTDGLTEMGLWYRLAPVTFMGGTLSGPLDQTRHPFEPAALGSAIIHGPFTEIHAAEWQQLDGAHAARRVRNGDELATAVAELTQAELIATLASNAWTVSTGGADVVLRIAERVVATINNRTNR